MESLKGPEIIRLKPEKDDSDTQSAVNQMIRKGAKDILILGATGTRLDHVLANLGLLSMGKEQGVRIAICRSVELYHTCRKRNHTAQRGAVWKICFILYCGR